MCYEKVALPSPFFYQWHKLAKVMSKRKCYLNLTVLKDFYSFEKILFDVMAV